MLSVDIEKIVPVTGARDMFNKIVDEVEGSDELYVLTKNGKPAAVVVGVNHLEKLTGETSGEIMTKVDQAKTEPEESSEVAKPLDTSITTPPADEPKETPSFTPSTDAFSAAPAVETPITPTSDFNASPVMPDNNSSTIETPDPMAPVTDGDAKLNEPAPTAPASTPTTDPMSASKTPNFNDLNNQPPATPPASNLG